MQNRIVIKIIPIFLIAIALFFGTYKLTESPPTWYDEGIILQPAINLALIGKMVVQVAPESVISPQFISVGYPVIYPISFVFKYFGIGLLQARVVMVVFIMLLACVFFLFAQEIFGFKYASLSTLLLVSFAPLYGNGKNVLGEIPGLFFLILFLYCVNKIEKNFSNTFYYIAAGISAGLCVVTKPLFLILLPAIFVTALLLRKRIEFRWKLILLSLVSFFIPFFVWLQTQFQKGDSSHNALGDTFSHAINYYINPYQVQDLFGIIVTNFVRFFTEISPAYFFILFIIWTISILIRAITKNKSISIAETVAFCFSCLLIGAYLRTAGWYRYFFPANILVFLFIPAAIETISNFLREKIAILNKICIIKHLPIVVIVFFAVVHFYQLGFNSWVANYYHSTRTKDLSSYFENSDFDGEKSIFVYDSPELILFLNNRNYYQYMELTDTFIIGNDQKKLIKKGIPDNIIIKSNVLEENKDSLYLYQAKDRFDQYTLLERK